MPEEFQGDSPAIADTGSAGTGATQSQQGVEGAQTGQEGVGQQARQGGSPQTDLVIPDAYKERGWAGKVKSVEDAFKLIDNQDQLIGKKTVTALDYTKATPEEIAEHHSKLAPKDASLYNFNASTDDKVASAVGDVFMKAGINEYQGKQVLQLLHPMIKEIEKAQNQDAVSEEGYAKLAQAAFGETFKTNLGKAEATLKQYAPDDDSKKVFDTMPNSQRIAVDKTVNKIVEGYEARISKILKEHGIQESGAQGAGGLGKMAGNLDDQRRDIRSQIRGIESRPHTAAEKQALIEKLASTYTNK